MPPLVPAILMHPTNPDEPDRSAATDPRVTFAAERTLLAWIRTGLALMGFGFVVARFGLFLRELAAARDPAAAPPGHPGQFSLWARTGLVLVGVLVNGLAAAEHVARIRRLRRGLPLPPRALSPGTVLGVLLAALGLTMAVYLIVVR